MAEITDLDPTDANNTGRWPEGMQYRDVNNAGRADEGLLARWFRDTNCSLSASGSAGAYSVTANRSITSYTDNLIIGFTANHTNPLGSGSLAVSGLLPKSIDGVLAGDIVSGAKVLVIFKTATDTWQRITAPPVVTSPVQVRVGSVLIWPTASIPSGFLLANGQSVAVASYPALFAEYGYTYGGSGANFNVPNYLDYFLRGFDAAGTDAASRTDRGDGTTGASVGTKQADEIEAHAHAAGTLAADSNGAHQHFIANSDTVDFVANPLSPTNILGELGLSGGFSTQYQLGGSATAASQGLTSSNGAHTHTVSGSTANNGSGSETRPKNITVNFIIVATPGAALATSGIGRNELWIGARHMTARATSGAASGTRDSGSNDITQPVFDFDQTTQEFVQFEWAPPKRWDRGTVSFVPYWTAEAGSIAETVAFTLQGIAFSNDDLLDSSAFGTAQFSVDALINAGDLHIGSESAAITIGGSPAVADLIIFQLSRSVASDNLAADARLLGIKLFWTSNAVSDD